MSAVKDGVYYPLGCSDGMSEGYYQSMCAELDNVGAPSPSLDQPTGIWRTRDGRMLKIIEMTTSHLENAIRFFEQSGWGEHPKIDELRNELDGRIP